MRVVDVDELAGVGVLVEGVGPADFLGAAGQCDGVVVVGLRQGQSE